MVYELTDMDEVLFRHIHPDFMNNGEPSSDRFSPSKRDGNKLSVDRSALTTAKDAHELFTADGAKALAVFGLSVGEFRGENIPCLSDPISQSEMTRSHPAHALADYASHVDKSQKIIAKKLKRLAVARGQLYPPI